MIESFLDCSSFELCLSMGCHGIWTKYPQETLCDRPIGKVSVSDAKGPRFKYAL